MDTGVADSGAVDMELAGMPEAIAAGMPAEHAVIQAELPEADSVAEHAAALAAVVMAVDSAAVMEAALVAADMAADTGNS
jgi:hypothetical protein